jgi:hypothetical protein
MDEINPYQPPKTSDTARRPSGDANDTGQMIYLAWFAVFVFNLAVPLLFALSITRESGRIGMSIAMVLLLATGCWICATSRNAGWSIVVGGIATGLSQAVPVLQMIAGIFGLAAAQILGAATMGDDERPDRISELGGFVVTLVTGAILMTTGAGVGLLFQRLGVNRSRRRA